MSRRVVNLPTVSLRKQELANSPPSGGEVVIIDNGTGWMKLGTSDKAIPSFIEPNLKFESIFGLEAENKSGVKMGNPNGQIDDFDVMIGMWMKGFDKIGIQIENKKLFMTQPAMNSDQKRAKCAELAFEKLNVSHFQMGSDPVLTLMSEDRNSGIVVDCGDGLTTCVPIVEGSMNLNALRSVRMGGRLLTSRFKQLAEGRLGSPLPDQLTARKAKEECSCARGFENELKSREFRLPDGNSVDFGDVVFSAADAYMDPQNTLDIESVGLAGLIFESLSKCPMDFKRELQENIMLTGGGSQIIGLNCLLYDSLKSMLPEKAVFDIITCDGPQYSAFIGASKLVNRSSFNSSWISRKDFDEIGKQVFKRMPIC